MSSSTRSTDRPSACCSTIDISDAQIDSSCIASDASATTRPRTCALLGEGSGASRKRRQFAHSGAGGLGEARST